MRRSLVLVIAVSVLFGLLGCTKQVEKKRDPSSIEPDKKIIIGIDGIGIDSFKYAQEELGLFSRFANKSVHVAPFPSISDYVWNMLVRGTEVFGDKARLKTFETAYYDEFTGKLDEDPRNYLIAHSNPYHYPRAFPIQYNVMKEVMGYQFVDVLLKGEIPSVEQQLMEADGDLLSAFIVGFDSISHVHKGYFNAVLQRIHEMVENVYNHYEKKGETVEIIILADHDLAGSMLRGDEEVPMTSIDIQKTINQAGLKAVTQFSNHDRKEAMPVILALASYVPIYFNDHAKVPFYVNKIKDQKWLQLAVYKKHFADIEEAKRVNEKFIHLVVANHLGEAEVIYDKESKLYTYRTTKGNPLELDEKYCNVWLDKEKLLAETVDHKYPDAIYRLIHSADNTEVDFPDAILSLERGYMTKGSLEGMVTMYRTHGSLGDEVSFGMIATTNDLRQLPERVRTVDVLDAIAVKPKDLFAIGGYTEEVKDLAADGMLEKGMNLFGMHKLATGISLKTPQRNADYLSKFIEHSKYILDIDKYTDIVKLDDTKPGNYELVLNLDNKFHTKSFLAGDYEREILDKEIEKSGEPKSKYERFMDKMKTLYSEKKYKAIMDLRQLTQATKAVVTGLYSSPSLIGKFFVAPDDDEITDERDRDFAKDWQQLSESEKKSLKNKERPSELLRNVFEEQKLVDLLHPQKLPLFYGGYPDDEVTVVYVSGIYDTIFDGTIFRPAMDNLKHLLGVRVIKSDVISTCSPKLNGKRLIKQVKRDYENRIRRGFKAPKYVFLGYSKGGIDTLAAFSEDPEFVRKHVLSLVTIASPLHGASIADDFGMPRFAIDAMSFEVTPQICREKENALDSLRPAALKKFWEEKESTLEGLTNYFSITFRSNVRSAHPWMKATKLLAQYKEDNDGVVEVSSSKFPASMNAIDFGTFEADHLSGNVSSHFEQVAFAKAIMISLTEMGIVPADQ